MAKPKTPNIWMPIYVGDYLSDTMHLTTEQHGAYFLLLLAYWKNKGPLPLPRIQNICQLNGTSWKATKAVLEEFFDKRANPGRWTHHRVEQELSISIKNLKSAQERGKKGMASRWKGG